MVFNVNDYTHDMVTDTILNTTVKERVMTLLGTLSHMGEGNFAEPYETERVAA